MRVRRMKKKLLETKLCCRNLNQGINTGAILLVLARYSGPFLTPNTLVLVTPESDISTQIS